MIIIAGLMFPAKPAAGPLPNNQGNGPGYKIINAEKLPLVTVDFVFCAIAFTD